MKKLFVGNARPKTASTVCGLRNKYHFIERDERAFYSNRIFMTRATYVYVGSKIKIKNDWPYWFSGACACRPCIWANLLLTKRGAERRTQGSSRPSVIGRTSKVANWLPRAQRTRWASQRSKQKATHSARGAHVNQVLCAIRTQKRFVVYSLACCLCYCGQTNNARRHTAWHVRFTECRSGGGVSLSILRPTQLFALSETGVKLQLTQYAYFGF